MTILQCFSTVSIEFPQNGDRKLNSKSSAFILNSFNNFIETPIKCYERRKKCLEARGWCYTENGEYGYCNEINELPDTPDPTHPLFEVQTFILPKEVNINPI